LGIIVFLARKSLDSKSGGWKGETLKRWFPKLGVKSVGLVTPWMFGSLGLGGLGDLSEAGLIILWLK
jgi:hypothetical protein